MKNNRKLYLHVSNYGLPLGGVSTTEKVLKHRAAQHPPPGLGSPRQPISSILLVLPLRSVYLLMHLLVLLFSSNVHIYSGDGSRLGVEYPPARGLALC